MPALTTRLLPARLALGVSALLVSGLLAGCSGGSAEAPDTSADPTDTPTTEAADPTPTAEESPTGTELTAEGTQLAFGDTATVAYDPGQDAEEAVLELTVESARKGRLADFAGFDLDDAYKRKGSYYYVRVAVRNAGDQRTGGYPVPLWGISGTDTLLRPVRFESAFGRCPTEPLPDRFRPRDRFQTCLVFLSPNRGSLEGVSYRPTEDLVPIEWRGRVERARGQNRNAGKDGAGKNGGGNQQ